MMDKKITLLLESVSESHRAGKANIRLAAEAMDRCQNAIKWQGVVCSKANEAAAEFADELSRLRVLTRVALTTFEESGSVQNPALWVDVLAIAETFSKSVGRHEDVFEQIPVVLGNLSLNIIELEKLTHQLCEFIDSSSPIQERLAMTVRKFTDS